VRFGVANYIAVVLNSWSIFRSFQKSMPEPFVNTFEFVLTPTGSQL
jgi:hypothetical protein